MKDQPYHFDIDERFAQLMSFETGLSVNDVVAKLATGINLKTYNLITAHKFKAKEQKAQGER